MGCFQETFTIRLLVYIGRAMGRTSVEVISLMRAKPVPSGSSWSIEGVPCIQLSMKRTIERRVYGKSKRHIAEKLA